jgi:hypothetical protein
MGGASNKQLLVAAWLSTCGREGSIFETAVAATVVVVVVHLFTAAEAGRHVEVTAAFVLLCVTYVLPMRYL